MSTSFIPSQNKVRTDYIVKDLNPRQSLRKRIASSKITTSTIFIVLFASSVPFLIYFFIFDRGSQPEPFLRSCSVDFRYRIQCGHQNATSKYCTSINCCYDNNTQTCYHFVPSYYYYSKYETSELFKKSLDHTPWGNDMEESVSLTIQELDENRVKIFLHKTSETVDAIKLQSVKNYLTKVFDDPLVAEIYRENDTNQVLLTTSKGPLIVSNNYWEWSFHLSDEYLFGLGDTLLSVPINTTLTKVVYSSAEDHSTLPNFMSHKNGSFHGLIVRHTGPLEVTVLPANLISLKWMTGSKIELELCVGPTPKDVMLQQRSNAIQPIVIPPPWVLGLHVCRGGSSTNLSEMISQYLEFAANNQDLSYESECIHENLVMALMKSTKKEKSSLKFDNSSPEKKIICSLPPHVLVDSDFFKTLSPDYFYKYSNGTIFHGNYLNEEVAFPDYSHPKINELTAEVLSFLTENMGTTPNYLALQDNWPVNDIANMTLPKVPYLSQDLIDAISETIPWDLKSYDDTTHWENHNDYGALQTQSINKTTEDGFIMTSSYNFETFNPLIVQNVNISWVNLRKTIKTILYHSIFGGRMVATPTCGSTEFYKTETDEIICIRWYLMAVTSPIFRISSLLPRRDPASLSSEYAKKIVRHAIKKRDQLRQYLYTTLKHYQEPIMRPMFYDFYYDNNTFALDYSQYMFGKSLIVGQPVLPDAHRLKIYLPPSAGIWYELWGGLAYNVTDTTDGWILFDVVESDWISFIKEGEIVPFTDSSDDGITLSLRVACKSMDCLANGMVIVKTEEILEFKCSANASLTISGLTDEAKTEMGCPDLRYVLGVVKLYGFQNNYKNSTNVYIDDNLCDFNNSAVFDLNKI